MPLPPPDLPPIGGSTIPNGPPMHGNPMYGNFDPIHGYQPPPYNGPPQGGYPPDNGGLDPGGADYPVTGPIVQLNPRDANYPDYWTDPSGPTAPGRNQDYPSPGQGAVQPGRHFNPLSLTPAGAIGIAVRNAIHRQMERIRTRDNSQSPGQQQASRTDPTWFQPGYQLPPGIQAAIDRGDYPNAYGHSLGFLQHGLGAGDQMFLAGAGAGSSVQSRISGPEPRSSPDEPQFGAQQNPYNEFGLPDDASQSFNSGYDQSGHINNPMAGISQGDLAQYGWPNGTPFTPENMLRYDYAGAMRRYQEAHGQQQQPAFQWMNPSTISPPPTIGGGG